MREAFLKSRKETTPIESYLYRQVSIYFTAGFVKLGVSPEQVLIFWGILSASNSFFIFKVIVGEYRLIPVCFVIYVVSELLDIVDGEIARHNNVSNPISGKVLDGVCHRITEYSILIAFTYAVYEKTDYLPVFFIGFLLLLGEAMYTYSYERKLLVIRLYAKKSEHIAMTDRRVSTMHSNWLDFSLKEKLESLKGFIRYKSIYLMFLLSYVSTELLLAGFIFLTAYKHFAWIKMVANLYFRPPEMRKL